MSPTATTARRSVLVIANDVAPWPALVETVCAAAADGARVLVVAPALTTRLRHWTSDRARAEAAARSRLLTLLAALERAGVGAEGTVGDADPALAAADALAVFDADEVIAASATTATWQSRRFVRRLQERFDGPILELPPPPPGRRSPGARLDALSPQPLV